MKELLSSDLMGDEEKLNLQLPSHDIWNHMKDGGEELESLWNLFKQLEEVTLNGDFVGLSFSLSVCLTTREKDFHGQYKNDT